MNRDALLIEPGELLQKLGDENLRLFDATFTDAPYRQGHIPGAAYFDHGRFSDPDSPYECTVLPLDRLIEQIGQSGISSDSEVVVYACGMLPYAGQLSSRFESMGRRSSTGLPGLNCSRAKKKSWRRWKTRNRL